jgi:two-component system, OmpR family, phosphate regulon sensor histidine kinase PhoR
VTLVQRLLLGALLIVSVLVAGVLLIAGERLRDRLIADETDDLRREARLIASLWGPATDADALADSTGTALSRRITLIDRGGVVRGDTEFDGAALARLDNHATRPEVIAAGDAGIGVADRRSPSAGDRELYVAVRAPLGYARVSLPLTSVDVIVQGARRDVMLGGAIGLLAALVLAALFARGVSRPVVELRDVARNIAAGNLEVRPALSAHGEVGDLAEALHRMAEQLAARLEKLRKDDAFMSALVEALDEGVIALDARGQVVRLNERSRELLGVADALPLAAERLPRSGVLRRAMEESLRGHDVQAEELLLGERTLAVTARPLRDGGAVITLLDLTGIRRLELVRRDFVANVSHELRTPLTVITGFAETLLHDELTGEQRQQFVESVHANGVRMQRIVDDLLDLSRIESGRWTPDITDIDFPALASEVIAGVRPRAAARGVTVEGRFDVSRVRADSTALRQVIANLVENAVRYTENGTITVSSEPAAEGATWIRVRDTGSGIAAEHLPRIFERFYRADPARSRSQGGTGLGLAIVKHLVEAHGGRVDAQSAPGDGTTVSVLLPG